MEDFGEIMILEKSAKYLKCQSQVKNAEKWQLKNTQFYPKKKEQYYFLAK